MTAPRRRLHELWLSVLHGHASPTEHDELVRLLSEDEGIGPELIEDVALDSVLAAMGRARHDGERFVAQWQARVLAEADGEAFVERVLRVVDQEAAAAPPVKQPFRFPRISKASFRLSLALAAACSALLARQLLVRLPASIDPTAWLQGHVTSPAGPATIAAAPGVPPKTPSPDVSSRTFANGARATAEDDAILVELSTQQNLTTVLQERGNVRYAASSDTPLQIVLGAASTRIDLRGSARLSLDRDSLELSVLEGSAHVHDPSLDKDLQAGDHWAKIPADPSASLPSHGRLPRSALARSTADRWDNATSRPSPKTLLREADTARAQGRPDVAVAKLEELLLGFPRDPSGPVALFTLGRLQEQQKAYARAAQSYLGCATRAPQGPLAEDALAEAARSFQKAGNVGKYQETARRYLNLYPSGVHARALGEP